MREELLKLSESVRDTPIPADIVGGAEEYGFQRAKDLIARKIRTLADGRGEGVVTKGEPHWVLVGERRVPVEAEKPKATPAKPTPTEWETHYLWEAKIAAVTKDGKPPTAATTDAGREDAIPPEATEVFPSALNGGTALPGDWAIPRAPGVNRIVDARMAYGWNECRKEMMRRLTPAGGEDGRGELLLALKTARKMIAGYMDAEYLAMDQTGKVGLGQYLDAAIAAAERGAGEG